MGKVKKVKVVLPMPEDGKFLFPRLCVVCLKPAKKHATAIYTETHYGILTRTEYKYSIEVPYCNEHYKEAKSRELKCLLVSLPFFLFPLFAYIIFRLPVNETYQAIIFLITFITDIAIAIYGYHRYSNPPGFRFKVVGDYVIFEFENPKYAEMFKAVNMMRHLMEDDKI